MQPLQKKGSFKSAQIKGVTVEVTLSSCVSPINEQLNVVVERGAKERKMFVVSGPIGRGRSGIFGGRGILQERVIIHTSSPTDSRRNAIIDKVNHLMSTMAVAGAQSREFHQTETIHNHDLVNK
jgi:hypothetical protein